MKQECPAVYRFEGRDVCIADGLNCELVYRYKHCPKYASVFREMDLMRKKPKRLETKTEDYTI